MNALQKWFARWRRKPGAIRLDPDVALQVRRIAREEDKPTEEVLSELLADGARAMVGMDPYDTIWRERLSEREREVAALICLGYQGDEISQVLNIRLNTVKTHAKNILEKFNLHSRNELRLALQSWNWDEWRKKFKL
jgi:DNA-binding NarL/FixJ family response regulator